MDVSGFMLDMDGTIYLGDRLIPGATEFISKLKEKGIPFMFVTNNSSHSRDYYYRKLIRMGFDVTMDNFLTSAVATCTFITSQRPGRKVYALATPEVMQEMRELGLELVEEDPDIVLLTFDRSITYEKINKAYNFLKAGAEFIATHPDDLCPTEEGYDIDIGPFIRMFEQMCRKDAIVIGKPNSLLMEMGAVRMHADPARTAMVGDRLYTDMEMAVRARITSVLVLSGETDLRDLKESGMKPTYVLDSIADLTLLL